MLSPPSEPDTPLLGDTWPPEQHVSKRSRSVLYSLSMGAPKRNHDSGAHPSPGPSPRTGASGPDVRLLQGTGRHSDDGSPRHGTAAGPTGQHYSAPASDRRGGFSVESNYHKFVLLGGHTRRSAQGGLSRDGQPSGGGTARRTSGTCSKRVRFADDEVRGAHFPSNPPARLVSSTDPQQRYQSADVGQNAQNSECTEGHGNNAGEKTSPLTKPTSSEVCLSPEPDQPELAATLAPESDPSLSAFELLAETLFDRISAGTRGDTSVQTAAQRQSFQLTEGKDDLLWRGNLLYVPDTEGLRIDILYWHHDVPWCGHLGIQKTLQLVQRQFWWPSIAIDIKNYVQTCYKCQSDKPDRRNKRPPLTFIQAPDSCWRTVGVDLIVDLTPSEPDQYNAIVVFCCHLSKMVRLVPTCTTLTTEGFTELFFKEVFPHYGMPTKIVSDRGPQWNSEFFRSLCDRADIRLSLSTAYHPQTNGLVERTNEVVETALRHYVAPDQSDWHKKLPFIEFALNNMYREATGSTPFRMNRITVPLAPFEAVKDRIATQKGLVAPQSELASWMGASVPKGERTYLQAKEEFARARQSVHWAKCKMKEAHDKKGVVNHHYQTGDLVWLSIKHISLRHPSLRHKFSPRLIGPVKVLQHSANGSTVLLELPSNLQIHPRVSVLRLLLAC